MSAFLKMIPAERGWRVVRVWEDAGKPHFEYEAVIAWGELEEKPGEAVPLLRDGWCERSVRPLDYSDDRFLALLAPGDVIDLEKWDHNIKWVLRQQSENEQREREQRRETP